MVEMLGVLAIVGVLSVIGIAGYKAAMTRHRANELLNEASKRAVVVAGQITLHGHNPSLSEFNKKDFSGGIFETTVYGATGAAAWANTDKQFTLSITGVDGSVCEQMKGTTSPVIKGFSPNSCDSDNPNTIKLTYNNDLSPDDLPDGNDTPAAEPCPAERQCGDTCCGEGNTCQNGQCCDGNGHCCTSGVPYIAYQEGSYVEVGCCVNGNIFVATDGDGIYEEGCCPKSHTLTDLGGYFHCCENGIAYHDHGDNLHCCPEGHTLTALGVCNDEIQCSICCEEGVGYCRNRNEYDECEESDCCTGTVSKGTGENGADECLE